LRENFRAKIYIAGPLNGLKKGETRILRVPNLGKGMGKSQFPPIAHLDKPQRKLGNTMGKDNQMVQMDMNIVIYVKGFFTKNLVPKYNRKKGIK